MKLFLIIILVLQPIPILLALLLGILLGFAIAGIAGARVHKKQRELDEKLRIDQGWVIENLDDDEL